MEWLLLIFVLFWSVVSWIEYFTFRRYLSRKYPAILSWLKGGPYYQKQTFYYFPLYNINRAFDLIFQKSEEFSKEHENEPALLCEYKQLINDKRYICEKRLNQTYLITLAFVLICFIYLVASNHIKMK